MTVPRELRLSDGPVVEIRRAVPADAASLLEHVAEVAAEEVFLQTERVERSETEQREWIAKFDGRDSLLLVGVREGQVVGTMDLHRGRQRKNAHVAELGIAVRKALRHRGLGRTLMEEGLDWARSVGVLKVHLQVFASNQPAISLYRRLGFQEEGRLKDHVVLRGRPDDLVLMSLWFAPGPAPG